MVLMPRLGVSVTEGTVSAWLKDVGDQVELGEVICEVATDKVDTEIESTVAGVLTEQRYAVGEVVLVGEPLAVVGDGAEAPAVAGPPASVAAPAPVLAASVTAPGLGPAAPPSSAPAPSATASSEPAPSAPGTPAVLRPGPFDHAAAAARLHEGRGRVSQSAPEPASASPQASAVPGTAPSALPAGYDDVPHDVAEPSRVRQVIAEHMSRSRRVAAHMTTEVDVDLGWVSQVRATLNQRTGRGQAKLSFLPFVARAACSALLEHPDLNATFETTRALRWKEVNLGIAVDTPRGLMVPVVRGAERLTVDPLAKAITELAEQARGGRIDPDLLRAGTFTLTNPGSVGAVSAPAIINQPQVAILGMPTIVRRPWVVRMGDGGEAIAVRPILRLALTFDHRWVDGADATRALVSIRDRLESWGADDYL
jgi:2-oxoglutarate dehydrogenase E2 component (dihydrolipoamide succinyltransferase)